MWLTLLSRKTETDIQSCGPHCVAPLAESGNVLCQHHAWEVYIYSCDMITPKHKNNFFITLLRVLTVTTNNFTLRNFPLLLNRFICLKQTGYPLTEEYSLKQTGYPLREKYVLKQTGYPLIEEYRIKQTGYPLTKNVDWSIQTVFHIPK